VRQSGESLEYLSSELLKRLKLYFPLEVVDDGKLWIWIFSWCISLAEDLKQRTGKHVLVNVDWVV